MEKVRTVQEEQPSSDVFRPGRDSFFADPDSSPIPSRIYDILQVVLETLLGSLPVPCSKTGAVLSWYESHQSTVPISYVIIGVIFLSVVVITLHSPTQIAWDTSVLAVLLGIWGLTNIYTRRIGRRVTPTYSTFSNYRSALVQNKFLNGDHAKQLSSEDNVPSASHAVNTSMRLPSCAYGECDDSTSVVSYETVLAVTEAKLSGSVTKSQWEPVNGVSSNGKVTPLLVDKRQTLELSPLLPFLTDHQYDKEARSIFPEGASASSPRSPAHMWGQFFDGSDGLVTGALESFMDSQATTTPCCSTEAAAMQATSAEATAVPEKNAETAEVLETNIEAAAVLATNVEGVSSLLDFGNSVKPWDIFTPEGIEGPSLYCSDDNVDGASLVDYTSSKSKLFSLSEFNLPFLQFEEGYEHRWFFDQAATTRPRVASATETPIDQGLTKPDNSALDDIYRGLFDWEAVGDAKWGLSHQLPSLFQYEKGEASAHHFGSEPFFLAAQDDTVKTSLTSLQPLAQDLCGIPTRRASASALNMFDHPINSNSDKPNFLKTRHSDSSVEPENAEAVIEDAAAHKLRCTLPFMAAERCVTAENAAVSPSIEDTAEELAQQTNCISQTHLQPLVECALNAVQTFVNSATRPRVFNPSGNAEEQASQRSSVLLFSSLETDDYYIPNMLNLVLTALIHYNATSETLVEIKEKGCNGEMRQLSVSAANQALRSDHPLWRFLKALRKIILADVKDYSRSCWPQTDALPYALLLPHTALMLSGYLCYCVDLLRFSTNSDGGCSSLLGGIESTDTTLEAMGPSWKPVSSRLLSALLDTRVLLRCVVVTSSCQKEHPFTLAHQSGGDTDFASVATSIAENLVKSYLNLGFFLDASTIFCTICAQSSGTLQPFSHLALDDFMRISLKQDAGFQFFDILESYAFGDAPASQLPSGDVLWPIFLKHRIALSRKTLGLTQPHQEPCQIASETSVESLFRNLSGEVCSDLLAVWIEKERFALASRLLVTLQQFTVRDPKVQLAMIFGYSKLQPPQLDEAFKCLSSIDLSVFKTHLISTPLNAILVVAISQGDINAVWQLVDRLNERRIPVEREACALLIKQLRPSSSAYNKKRILELIDRTGISADVSYFAAVVDACARLKDTRRLRSIIARYTDANFVPNVHAFGTLIKAYGRCGETKKAWELWNIMLSNKDLQPTNYTYGCMLDMLVSNGCVENAIALLRDALRMGRGTNTVQYSILIKGCAQQKLLPQALELYAEMRRHGVACNGVTYNTLINACVAAHDIERAESVARDMLATNSCQPDVITYSTLIKGFCDQGRVERALQFFHLMEEKNVQADVVVFNTLLEGCAKQKNVQLTERIFVTMLERGVAPSSFTLTILVKFLGKMGRLSRALQLAEELPVRYRFDCDAYVYTALIAACLTNNDLVTALRYFAEMNAGQLRHSVSARTFGTVIVGCLKANVSLLGYSLVCEAARRCLSLEKRILLRLCQALKAPMPSTATSLISNSTRAEICQWLTRYPTDPNAQPPCPPPQLPPVVLSHITQQLGLSRSVVNALFLDAAALSDPEGTISVHQRRNVMHHRSGTPRNFGAAGSWKKRRPSAKSKRFITRAPYTPPTANITPSSLGHTLEMECSLNGRCNHTRRTAMDSSFETRNFTSFM